MAVLIESVAAWRQLQPTIASKRVGLVATMGNLHAGHMSLVMQSVANNEITVLSAFINSTQFNVAADFKHYPRTFAADWALSEQYGVDYFFKPCYDDFYPDDYRYRISEHEQSTIMEGEYRPGHFSGMLTVVLKLLLLIRPDRSYFGEKDYQQLQLVQGMVDAFFLETEVVPCRIVRDDHGMALSSRNQLLTSAQLQQARYLFKYLTAGESCDQIIELLKEKGFEVEYIQEHNGRRFAAVYLDGIRLIDNVEVTTC